MDGFKVVDHGSVKRFVVHRNTRLRSPPLPALEAGSAKGACTYHSAP